MELGLFAMLDAPPCTQTPSAQLGARRPVASIDDIPQELAERAFSGVSFSPEKRGASARADYVRTFEAVRDRLEAKATTDEQRAALWLELERFRMGLLTRWHEYLGSYSRVMSPMITGPSNFPTERMRKYGGWADNKMAELASFPERAEAAILRRMFPNASGIIRTDQADAAQQLQTEIDKAKTLQETMREANKIVRKKATDEQKTAELVGLGIKPLIAAQLLINQPGYGMGFPAFELSNNSANIRRMEQRLDQLTKLKAQAARSASFPGGKIEEDKTDMRVRIAYDGKPPRETIERLKSSGFRWSPSLGVWQRLANEAGWRAALAVTGATA
jgi:hypothetical protein